MLRIAIDPIGKPRMTQRDVWKKRPCVMRYRQFCDELRLQYRGLLPDKLTLRFVIAMPLSWSKKKRLAMDGQPHQQKPDIDNLVKSVLDALCSDDSYVWHLEATKCWGQDGLIQIEEWM